MVRRWRVVVGSCWLAVSLCWCWRLVCVGLVLLYYVGVWFENIHRLYRRGVMMMVAICDLSIRIGCRSGWFWWVGAFQHILRHPVQHLLNYVDYT